MQYFIQHEIQKLAAVLAQIEQNQPLLTAMTEIATLCTHAVRNGRKIMWIGNGGSAADAQHLAAELTGRLSYHRPGIAAVALTTDTSALTAIGNDYGFEDIFARQVEAIGQSADVLIGISTSGQSPNVLRALETARAKNIATVGFTGMIAPKMDERCDWVLHVPSKETPKIQECHIMLGHIICALIEETLFGAEYNPARNKLHDAHSR